METKRCSKCGEEKPLSEFYRNSSRKDSLSFYCKSCESNRLKEYYKLNRDRHYTTHRKYVKRQNRKSYLRFYSHSRIWELRDGYVRYSLLKNGFTADQITPDLIELKRAELKLKRAIKEKTNERS